MHTPRPASTSIVRPPARTSVAAPARSRSGNGFPVPSSTTSIATLVSPVQKVPEGNAPATCPARPAAGGEHTEGAEEEHEQPTGECDPLHEEIRVVRPRREPVHRRRREEREAREMDSVPDLARELAHPPGRDLDRDQEVCRDDAPRDRA